MEYTLYHGTSIENANRIIDDNFIHSNSDPKNQHWHWLGDGIYFYDELESSKKWAKRNCHCGKGYSVIECVICVDRSNVLDFHSQVDANKFLDTVKSDLLDEFSVLEKDIEEGDHIKRKVLYTMIMAYCELKEVYLVIASIIRHPTNEKNLWFQNLGIATDFEKQFCLREKSCIKTKRICYNNIGFIEIV